MTAVWLAALAQPAITRKPMTAGNDRAVAARATWTTAVTARAAVIWLAGPIRWASRPSSIDPTVAARKNDPSPHP